MSMLSAEVDGEVSEEMESDGAAILKEGMVYLKADSGRPSRAYQARR